MDAISCVAPPGTTSLALLARALHFSAMSSDSTASSSSSSYQYYYSPPLTTTMLDQQQLIAYAPPVTCDAVLVASDYSPTPPQASAGRRLGPAGARAGKQGKQGKRRSRASKRATTTYISTDPSNFRLMVQHITGVQADPDSSQLNLDLDYSAATASSLLLDTTTSNNNNNPLLLLTTPAPAPAGDHHLNHQAPELQQPCFPTLDSWNVTTMNDTML